MENHQIQLKPPQSEKNKKNKFLNQDNQNIQSQEKDKNQASDHHLNLNLTDCLQVKCKGGNQAEFICYSKKCELPAFTCKKKQCPCRELHSKCVKVGLSETIQNLQKKIINFESLIEENDSLISKKIDDLVNKILEEMSKAREQVYDFLTKHFELHGLSQLEKQFYKLVKQNQINQITGQQIYQIFQDFHKEPTYTLEGQIQKIKQFWQNSEIETNAELNTKIKQIKEYFQYKQYSICQYESNILTTCQDLINLNQLFNYKIEKLELLYIASQSNFQTDQFRFDCKDIPHTVTLIETNGNKKIGGYTPLTWSTNTYDVVDKDKKTFLFSLTNNQKFVQSTQNGGISNSINQGPFFKNYNKTSLRIVNNSDQPIVQTKDNWGNIKCSPYSQFSLIEGFTHKNYTGNDMNSCLRFAGVKNTKFTTNQWQVWKVIFKTNKPNHKPLKPTPSISQNLNIFEANPFINQNSKNLFAINSSSNSITINSSENIFSKNSTLF